MDVGTLLVNVSYVLGSILFLGGSVMFHPHFSVYDVVYKVAVALFIVGSVLFLLPALYGWRGAYLALTTYTPPTPSSATSGEGDMPHLRSVSISTAPEDITSPLLAHDHLHQPSGESSPPTHHHHHQPSPSASAWASPPTPPAGYVLGAHGVVMSRATLSIVNGVLFTLGSIVYWPSYGHAGIVAGNWLYRTGSTITIFSCTWALLRLFGVHTQYHTPRMLTMLRAYYIQMIIGGLCYFVGGIYFIHHEGKTGAYLWVVGSTGFVTASTMSFFM